jgi:hypothetical protein
MKLLKVLVAALLLAAMVTPAIAEDRLSLSGEMRVRAFTTDFDLDVDGTGPGKTSDYGYWGQYLDNVSDGVKKKNNTETWANQRLRIAGKIAVAEGVSITFRTDITEGTNWGDSSSFGSGPGNPERSNGFGHARSGSQQQWDRAHMDLDFGMFSLRAGQQYFGTGGTWAIDTQDSGLTARFKTPLPVNVFFIVDKDNASLKIQDNFLYGGDVQYKSDAFSAKLILAGYHGDDGGNSDNQNEEVYMVGVQVSGNFGPVKLFGEFDHFDGDAVNDEDAHGDQLFVDASFAATDAMTFGVQGFYAKGDDNDVQYVRLGNGFNGWDPIMDVGTSLSNEEIVLGNPFDWSGFGAGVTGGRLYGNFKATDKLSFGASAAYLETEDDNVVDADEYALAGGMVYKLLANTSFQLQVQYEDGEVENEDYNAFRAGTGLFVSF